MHFTPPPAVSHYSIHVSTLPPALALDSDQCSGAIVAQRETLMRCTMSWLRLLSHPLRFPPRSATLSTAAYLQNWGSPLRLPLHTHPPSDWRKRFLRQRRRWENRINWTCKFTDSSKCCSKTIIVSSNGSVNP